MLEGMTEQQLDQIVLNNMVAIQGDQGQYNPMGMRIFSTNSNCHNTTTTLLERSGVSTQQTNEIGNKLFRDSGYKFIPGFGNQFSTPSAIQVVQKTGSETITSIQKILSNIINRAPPPK